MFIYVILSMSICIQDVDVLTWLNYKYYFQKFKKKCFFFQTTQLYYSSKIKHNLSSMTSVHYPVKAKERYIYFSFGYFSLLWVFSELLGQINDTKP